MKRLIAKLGLLLPIATAVAMLVPSSAYAVVLSSGVVTGAGTTTPITTAPAFQAFTFGGTATGVFDTGGVPIVGSCNITSTGASDITETVILGEGRGTATCNGAVTASAIFTYNRAGGVVVIDGSCVVNGVTGILTGEFAFVPTTVNPTTSFNLAGVIECNNAP
jgi:hypothetical protein